MSAPLLNHLAMPTQTLTVPDDSDDLRLDRFLASSLALSRSQLQRLIKEGSVLVAGRAAKANQPVKPGQEISIDVPEPIEAAPAPEPIVIEIGRIDVRILAPEPPRAAARPERAPPSDVPSLADYLARRSEAGR